MQTRAGDQMEPTERDYFDKADVLGQVNRLDYTEDGARYRDYELVLFPVWTSVDRVQVRERGDGAVVVTMLTREAV